MLHEKLVICFCVFYVLGWTLGPGQRIAEVPTINGMVLLVAQHRYDGILYWVLLLHNNL